MFGMPLSIEMGVPFAPARKPGKLPYSTVSTSYSSVWTNTLEMHTDAIANRQRVLIIDDLLATGGTAKATQQLIHDLGGTVAGFQFLVELDFLGGRSALGEARVDSLVHYLTACHELEREIVDAAGKLFPGPATVVDMKVGHVDLRLLGHLRLRICSAGPRCSHLVP